MTNVEFGMHLKNIREGYEFVTEDFAIRCNKQQFEYVMDHLEKKPFARAMLHLGRIFGRYHERQRFELTNVDTSTWD